MRFAFVLSLITSGAFGVHRASNHERIRELYLDGRGGVEGIFPAVVNNFDHSSADTFDMRYWVDDTYWNGSTPVVLLSMGGEGASGPPGEYGGRGCWVGVCFVLVRGPSPAARSPITHACAHTYVQVDR